MVDALQRPVEVVHVVVRDIGVLDAPGAEPVGLQRRQVVVREVQVGHFQETDALVVAADRVARKVDVGRIADQSRIGALGDTGAAVQEAVGVAGHVVADEFDIVRAADAQILHRRGLGGTVHMHSGHGDVAGIDQVDVLHLRLGGRVQRLDHHRVVGVAHAVGEDVVGPAVAVDQDRPAPRAAEIGQRGVQLGRVRHGDRGVRVLRISRVCRVAGHSCTCVMFQALKSDTRAPGSPICGAGSAFSGTIAFPEWLLRQFGANLSKLCGRCVCAGIRQG